MPFERTPRRRVPRNMIVKNSVQHPVKDGESWETLADKFGLSADEIIYANFWTLLLGGRSVFYVFRIF